MNRMVVAAAMFSVLTCGLPAHAQVLQGDEQAIALADRMLETLGGRTVWVEARTLEAHLLGDYARDELPWNETFWMDLESPTGRFELKNEHMDRVIVWTPEGGWEWDDGDLEQLPEDRHAFELDYWRRQPYVIFHRLATGTPATRVEMGTNELGTNEFRFDVFDADSDELLAQFAVNMRGEPIKWGSAIGEMEFEHVFGPLREFDGFRLPAWGATITGIWRYEHVEVSMSPSPPTVSLEPPS